jgi:hypothetical protein
MIPSSASRSFGLGEILVVVARADVLEHADAADTVERSLDVAVVDLLELDLVGDARSLRPLVGELDLIGARLTPSTSQP